MGWGDYTLVETIVAAKRVYWKAQNITNIRQFNIITSVVSCNCGGKNPVVVNLWLLGGTTIYRGYIRHRVPGSGLCRGWGAGRLGDFATCATEAVERNEREKEGEEVWS